MIFENLVLFRECLWWHNSQPTLLDVNLANADLLEGVLCGLLRLPFGRVLLHIVLVSVKDWLYPRSFVRWQFSIRPRAGQNLFPRIANFYIQWRICITEWREGQVQFCNVPLQKYVNLSTKMNANNLNATTKSITKGVQSTTNMSTNVSTTSKQNEREIADRNSKNKQLKRYWPGHPFYRAKWFRGDFEISNTHY